MARQFQVHHPKLATFFRGLRPKKWSVKRVVDRAAELGFAAVTPQTVRWLEKGYVLNPNPDVVRGLAAVYKRDYADLWARVLKDTGRDLPLHTLSGTTSPPAGLLKREGEHARSSAETRVVELERLNRKLVRALARTYKHAQAILHATADLPKTRPTHRNAAGGGHHGRTPD